VTVVAVSADALDEQIGRARQAGADGYWIKPITPSQLVRFLQAGPARWPGLLKPPV
jgi:CheY-like chemotaxis protein